eukprot:7003771-Lingulodinium_polyedra.AAC.1
MALRWECPCPKRPDVAPLLASKRRAARVTTKLTAHGVAGACVSFLRNRLGPRQRCGVSLIQRKMCEWS